MAFTLGDLTLPNPKEFYRDQIETGASVTTLSGITKKDIASRKERFVLRFELLTQTQVSAILAEWGYQTYRNFTVSETYLSIGATPVHIEIASREYNTMGNQYREDMTLILTEVS